MLILDTESRPLGGQIVTLVVQLAVKNPNREFQVLSLFDIRIQIFDTFI